MVTGKEYLTKYDIKSPQTKRQIKIIPETLLLWQKNPMIFKPSSSGDLTSGFGTAALSTLVRNAYNYILRSQSTLFTFVSHTGPHSTCSHSLS